jgi:putative effector of murein hydrolase LrgA (UPF0299 family)
MPKNGASRKFLRYVVAILACVAIIFLYSFLVVIFEWQHGGGIMTLALLFAALSVTWKCITKP